MAESIKNNNTNNKKNHLIVFVAYQNSKIVANSFSSIYQKKDADFFVVENFSSESDLIEKFFNEFKENDDFIGHIRFGINIANSAVNVFLEQFKDLISKYEYLTITDGDLILYDVNNAFSEIFEGLNQSDVVVATCDLWTGNHYKNEVIYGFKEFADESKQNQENSNINQCVDGHTGNFLLTIKTENLSIFDDILYLDSFIAQKVNQLNKRWVKTTNNLAYHETWDLYRDGNPYYEFKRQVYDKIWFERKNSAYVKLK